VLLTYAFIATERAAKGAADRPPPLPAVAKIMIYEMTTQITESEGLERLKAHEVAEAIIKRLTHW
jgi:hypothetical protein